MTTSGAAITQSVLGDDGFIVPQDCTFEEFASLQFTLLCAAYDTQFGVTTSELERYWPAADRGTDPERERVYQHVTDGRMSEEGQVWRLYVDDESATFLLVKLDRDLAALTVEARKIEAAKAAAASTQPG